PPPRAGIFRRLPRRVDGLLTRSARAKTMRARRSTTKAGNMRARVGDIEVEYELLGPEAGEPLVLICGMYQQLTSWPEPFLDELTAAGFQVLVFDNRDVGLSTWETRPAPDVLAVFGGDISTVNYTSYDLAADTVGLMDAVGWDSAHVFGHSMGSGIAQLVATEYPERVRTLTLFGS